MTNRWSASQSLASFWSCAPRETSDLQISPSHHLRQGTVPRQLFGEYPHLHHRRVATYQSQPSNLLTGRRSRRLIAIIGCASAGSYHHPSTQLPYIHTHRSRPRHSLRPFSAPERSPSGISQRSGRSSIRKPGKRPSSSDLLRALTPPTLHQLRLRNLLYARPREEVPSQGEISRLPWGSRSLITSTAINCRPAPTRAPRNLHISRPSYPARQTRLPSIPPENDPFWFLLRSVSFRKRKRGEARAASLRWTGLACVVVVAYSVETCGKDRDERPA